MTVNEMINELQKLVANGYGDVVVEGQEWQEFTCFEEDEKHHKVILWISD